MLELTWYAHVQWMSSWNWNTWEMCVYALEITVNIRLQQFSLDTKKNKHFFEHISSNFSFHNFVVCIYERNTCMHEWCRFIPYFISLFKLENESLTSFLVIFSCKVFRKIKLQNKIFIVWILLNFFKGETLLIKVLKQVKNLKFLQKKGVI